MLNQILTIHVQYILRGSGCPSLCIFMLTNSVCPDLSSQSLSIIITSSSSTPQSGDGLLAFCFCFCFCFCLAPVALFRCGGCGTRAPPAPTGPASRATERPSVWPVPLHEGAELASWTGVFSFSFSLPLIDDEVG